MKVQRTGIRVLLSLPFGCGPPFSESEESWAWFSGGEYLCPTLPSHAESKHSTGFVAPMCEEMGVSWAMESGKVTSSQPHAGYSACRLLPMASLMDSVRLIRGLPLFLLPCIFPALLSFPKASAISWCAQSGRTASVLAFVPPAMFQAFFALGPPVCLCPSRVSVDLSSNTFQILVFFPMSLLHCTAFPSVYCSTVSGQLPCPSTFQ